MQGKFFLFLEGNKEKKNKEKNWKAGGGGLSRFPFRIRKCWRLAVSPPPLRRRRPPLLRRGLSAQPQPATPPPPADDGAGAWARSAAALSLLGLTGAVAASAVSDLSVFLSCSSQAIEKATQNQQIVNAIGKPIVRSPWYNASIAVNHARHSVSCTFPVSGPQGDGLLKFKAVRLGDESWFSFLQRSDWEILLMDAILDVPTDDGKHQTIRVTIPDNTIAPPPVNCRACKPQSTLTPPPEK